MAVSKQAGFNLGPLHPNREALRGEERELLRNGVTGAVRRGGSAVKWCSLI